MMNKDRPVIRKIIHLSLGLIVLALSYIIEKNVLLVLIAAGTIFSFLTFNYSRFQLLHKTSDASLGTLYYPVGILLSYLVLYNLPLYYFQSSLMVLTVSDSLAYFAGQMQKGNIWFRAFHDKKSLYGIIAYSLSALFIFMFFLPGILTSDLYFILFAVLCGIILETASIRGSDNFTIPAGLALFFLVSFHYEIDYFYLTAILIGFAAGSFLLFKFNILSRRGSFVAFLLGFYLAGINDLAWLTSVLIFFLSSAALTKLHHTLNEDVKESGARSAWQVIANIIWALLSSVLFSFTGNEIFIMFFIVFVAAVTADTWASEIGPLLNKRCFSPSEMRMVPAGTNGGISLSGSIAALSGSVIISSFSYFIFFDSLRWNIIAILSISAFIACFADSMLGAFAEKGMLKMNYFRKRKSPETITPNDIINMTGSLTAFIFYVLFSWLFN